MKQGYDTVTQFINSFGRRNFSEMSGCLTDDFIFDGSIIYIEGREKFLKFQKKVDSSYVISPFELQANNDEDVYLVNFAYEIHFHDRKKIKLPARAIMYLRQELIFKVEIKFRDVEEAKSIFNQMVRH
ncbi:MAG: nuclear transport factor 2 family protein [OCS116 cluster bacterium]|uniref:SnoaL-like domain-containing protein n=1 Tax=OCS116 cluster bacterium TaxID=2030921 RepID=A0A2A4YSV4_9PROT|nr:nuclear transport factor 2 family protein [OCS116 cluster bacterium]